MTGTPPGCSGASFLAGIRDASGMFFGALLFGILFGSAASVAGLDMGQTVAMSAFIFAGTAQFATLALWSDQMPYFAILISAAMVTSRLTLMGLSLGPTIRGLPSPLRLPAIFVINDAAWALTLQAKSIPNKSAYYLGVSAPMYAIWVAATAVGVFSAGLFDPVTAKSWPSPGSFSCPFWSASWYAASTRRAPLAVSAGVGIALDGVIEPGAAVLVAVAAGAVTALASEVMRDAR